MRSVVHGAVASARKLLEGAVGNVIGASGPSEDEQLAQYMAVRGNPAALSAFVNQHRALWGADSNPLSEQARYERAMEEKLRERGFGSEAEASPKGDAAAFTAGLPKGW